MVPSSSRGSSFWLFIFGVAFGALLGAVLMHKYLTEHAVPAPAAPHGPSTEAPGSRTDDAFDRVLREWHLTPEDIRRQVDRAGQVIRREGGALGQRIDTAMLDPRIITTIKAKYTLDPELSAWDIAVSSRDGHVTLGGTVNEPDLAVRAVVLALDTRGVVDVTSDLAVKSSAAPPLPPIER